MMQEGLFGYLTAQAGITALTGSRVYPLVIPQRSYDEVSRQPCLVYTVSRERAVSFSGTNNLVSASVQLDSYARTYAEALTLAAAVRTALVDFSGTWTSTASPQGVTKVQRVFIRNEIELTDPEPGLYRVMQEYQVWYEE